LVARERARLDEPHAVADLALVLLVVRLVAGALAQELLVLRVANEAFDDDDHRLVHLVRDHHAFAMLPSAGLLAFAHVTFFMRARVLRLAVSFTGFEICAVARLSLIWNSSSVSSRSRAWSSSSERLRSSITFMCRLPLAARGSASGRRASRRRA